MVHLDDSTTVFTNTFELAKQNTSLILKGYLFTSAMIVRQYAPILHTVCECACANYCVRCYSVHGIAKEIILITIAHRSVITRGVGPSPGVSL